MNQGEEYQLSFGCVALLYVHINAQPNRYKL
ncbi:MAG: hypothetical protein JWR72_522 [Flavisolibacter sp.]|jgi:hypothetical protein|nr:hypothetical protein [Flavisolibacter sp.]